MFDLTVETWVEGDPSGVGFGGVTISFSIDLGADPGDWRLSHLKVTGLPVRSDGESLDFYASRLWLTPGAGDAISPGSRVSDILGFYEVWPDSPRGYFSGGEVTVYAYRYVEVGEWVSREEASQSVAFAFTIPRRPAATPEPAAAISAAIATLAGGAFAARRRRSRLAAPAA